MFKQVEDIYPNLLKLPTGWNSSCVSLTPEKPARQVLGSSYPEKVYLLLYKYWQGIEFLQPPAVCDQDAQINLVTTWPELTLDFIHTSGVYPASWDYGCTNSDTAQLAFITMSKRIWHAHGLSVPLRNKCKALDAIGLSIATGLDVKVKLRNLLHVISSLADIASHQPAYVDRWKTLPHMVWQLPLALIQFQPRRGILQSTPFAATHAHMLTLNPDIVQGPIKAVARIKQPPALRSSSKSSVSQP